jgi:hypothetical protein
MGTVLSQVYSATSVSNFDLVEEPKVSTGMNSTKQDAPVEISVSDSEFERTRGFSESIEAFSLSESLLRTKEFILATDVTECTIAVTESWVLSREALSESVSLSENSVLDSWICRKESQGLTSSEGVNGEVRTKISASEEVGESLRLSRSNQFSASVEFDLSARVEGTPSFTSYTSAASAPSVVPSASVEWHSVSEGATNAVMSSVFSGSRREERSVIMCGTEVFTRSVIMEQVKVVSQSDEFRITSQVCNEKSEPFRASTGLSMSERMTLTQVLSVYSSEKFTGTRILSVTGNFQGSELHYGTAFFSVTQRARIEIERIRVVGKSYSGFFCGVLVLSFVGFGFLFLSGSQEYAKSFGLSNKRKSRLVEESSGQRN